MSNNPTHISHHKIRITYFSSIALATGMFAFHSMVLIETGWVLTKITPYLLETFGIHLFGPLLILGAFLVLFTTHIAEAFAWGLFFRRIGEFKSLEESIYFAGTSLTALGYGDIVLRHPWQRLGPVMATNGILMYGCSTAFLFLIIQQLLGDNS